MDRVLPVAEAVLMGTVDSIENFAINIRDKLPRFGKQQEQPECLSGKVSHCYRYITQHIQHGSLALHTPVLPEQQHTPWCQRWIWQQGSPDGVSSLRDEFLLSSMNLLDAHQLAGPHPTLVQYLPF